MRQLSTGKRQNLRAALTCLTHVDGSLELDPQLEITADRDRLFTLTETAAPRPKPRKFMDPRDLGPIKSEIKMET